MRLLSLTLTLTLLTSCSIQPSIVGSWKCTRPEVINTEEFLADGTLISHYELLGDFPKSGQNAGTWKILQGDRLQIDYKGKDTNVVSYEVKGDKFRYVPSETWCERVSR